MEAERCQRSRDNMRVKESPEAFELLAIAKGKSYESATYHITRTCSPSEGDNEI